MKAEEFKLGKILNLSQKLESELMTRGMNGLSAGVQPRWIQSQCGKLIYLEI